jgi:signal transduction histidine kinase
MAVVALACSVGTAAARVPAAATDGGVEEYQKRVIVFYPASSQGAGFALLERELQRILGDRLGGRLDYYAEFLDLARFTNAEYQGALRDFLHRKYDRHRFDVVIAVSDACVVFVEDSRDSLFPGAPVVFLSSPGLRHGPNSTGVISDINLRGTLALAHTLQPGAKQVFVASGASDYDRFYENVARAQFQPFEGRFTFTYLSGLPMRDIEQRVARLPRDSIIYYLMLTQDGAGDHFLPLDALDRVSTAANAPIYGWFDVTMDHGIMGGSLRSFEVSARHTADLALRVLRGEKADSIPATEIDTNVSQVDWRQLRRWGISEDRVPSGTLVRFREPSAWARYRFYIAGAISLLILQTALIGGLLVQRVRRRRAERDLRKSETELRRSYVRIQDLAGRLISAQEAERTRIARELHDDVSQQLALLSVELQQLGNELPAQVGPARTRARELWDRAGVIATSVHELSHQLHPIKLEMMGLVSSIAGLQRELSSQYGLAIHFSHKDVPARIPRDVALCMFRIVQEGLRNAIKHSGAEEVSVQLAGGPAGLSLTIADDGAGFEKNVEEHEGLGLVSMRERLEPVGGTLRIRSSPGVGTRIEVTVPLVRNESPTMAAQ